MSIFSKAVITVVFFTLIVALIALLPSVTDYPIPPSVLSGIVLIVGYYFAWSHVFTFLNTLFFFFVLTMFIEIYVWTAKVVLWVIGIVARFVG